MREQTEKVDKRLQIAVRSVGAVLPLLALTFGLLMKFDILPFKLSFFNDTLLIFFALFMIIGFATLTMSNRPRLQLAIRIFGAELVFMLYTLLVSGFSSYLAICWLILVYESYRVFQDKGMRISFAIIIATFILDFVLRADQINGEFIYNNLVALILVIGASIFVTSMTKVQMEEEENLKESEAKERLERSRLETLINSMSSGIISFDRHGIIHKFNASSLSLLDTNANIQGKSINDVVTLTDKDGYAFSVLDIAQDLSSSAMRDDLYYHYKDSDEVVRLEIILSPIKATFSAAGQDEDVDAGYIMIMRDVTKEKSLEEERETFISVVSHELRTPIAIAEGAIGNAMFLNSKGMLTAKNLGTSLSAVHDNITALSRMVNDLNTLSRAESNDDEKREPLQVADMIDALYNKHAADAVTKGLQLNIDRQQTMDMVLTSRLYLTDILENFISNALKYTTEGSITLFAKQVADTITVGVKDTGNGIAKTDLPKIFDKFYRSEDYRTRETGGNGLGLYIASRLAAKLGTTITVESRYHHGSEFSITLPIYAPEKAGETLRQS